MITLSFAHGKAYGGFARDPRLAELSSHSAVRAVSIPWEGAIASWGCRSSSSVPIPALAGGWRVWSFIPLGRGRVQSIHKSYWLWLEAEGHLGFCKWGGQAVSRLSPQSNDFLQHVGFPTGIQTWALAKSRIILCCGYWRLGRTAIPILEYWRANVIPAVSL